MCRKSLPGKVAHSDAIRAAFETLKARMISDPVLLIPKSGYDAEFVVASDASKVGIAGVLLQEDSDGHMRPCAYWARKLKDAETRYSAYDREALAMVEAASRVWKIRICSVLNASQWSRTMRPLSNYSSSQVIN